MIQKILLFNLLLFSITGISQEITKKVEIYKHVSGEYINAVKTIENGEEKDLQIHFMGRNHKYQHIDDLLTFSYSSPSEFYKFLNKLIGCFEHDKDTSLKVDGLNVTVDKMMGKKIIILWDKDMRGYRWFNEKTLNKILVKYETWCKENNVTYLQS